MRTFLTICGLALLATVTPRVEAHAFLDHSKPKVGSAVKTSPKEVKLWFTEKLEPKFSNVQVFDKNDKQVDKKDKHVDTKDPTLLIVSLPKHLAPGEYKVVWHVVSVDAHRTQGHFKFTVK